ncbi:unnamed protein product [Phytophthora lilii]|uniref:Unnamed protein product n=1 Tax=Phytophthora lilii TaxID=2077276 RepID=A0A9W6TVP9_9STRA|nr:unnamed protein product [Phytophthora lilii]
MEVRTKEKIRGTVGCELLRHVESVDPRAAEGLRRQKPSDVPHDMEVLLEEETRRSISDPYQRLLFEVKALHRKGNFKSSQGEMIVQRVRDIASGVKTVLDLAGFVIFDEFVDLLVPYLRSKTCQLVALNLARTPLGVQAAIDIAKATNNVLQMLQFSDQPIPVKRIRMQADDGGKVVVSGFNFNHLDAAAIGILVERERKKIQALDLSGNLLTGPKFNVFHVGNHLDYLCSIHIAEMLKVNCTIILLNLAQNPLGDAGAVDVSTALKKNATLLSLKCVLTLACDTCLPDKMCDCSAFKDAKSFTGFPALTETQRTNFVDKLERFSDSELRQLHEERIVENAALFSDEKEAAGLFTLRHYAAMEQYAPLKRMLWCFEVGNRYKHLVDRSNNKGATTNRDEDEEDEELKPKNERRPIPKTPPGIGEGGGGMTRQEVEALNQTAQEAYNVHGMETCEFCAGPSVDTGSHNNLLAEPEVEYGRARPPTRQRLDSSSSQSSLQSDVSGGMEATSSSSPAPQRPTSSGGGSRALAGSLASNRKKIPGQDAPRQRIQSPLDQNVEAASLAQELQGKESMINIIQAKLDHWESTTLATLQEIRDLKEVFAQLNTS